MKNSYPLFKTVLRMLKNISERDRSIYAMFSAYTLCAFVYPFFSVLLPKLVIGELTLPSPRPERLAVIVSGFFVVSALFGSARTYLRNYIYPRLTLLRIDYIRDMFAKIVGISYRYMEDSSFFDKNDRALEACSGNSNGMEGIYHKLFELPATVLTVIAFCAFVGSRSVLILFGLIAYIAVSVLVSRRVHDFEYSRKEALAHAERRKLYYYRTAYDFAYGKDIRLYGLKERILSNYEKEIEAFAGINREIRRREFRLSFLELAVLLASNALVYGTLAYKAAHGMPIADFSMYLSAALSLTLLMKSAADDFSYIVNEGQYVHDFYMFIDSDLGDKGGARRAIENDTLEIEFRDASFRYPGTDRDILAHFNFKIKKGEKLAIVGVNGAGKSTIVKLMTGLFDLTGGDILINGISIREFDRQELYKMFSVVFQDVNVLAFTVKENVAASSENIDEKRVLDALERVGLGPKIGSLPDGVNQMMLKIIEENGAEFSGGESQKLSIARALYKDANMVIMDEPTAALDALAEAEIYESFSSLVEGKTAVYISHRLASTKFCDKIALFDGGGLKEYGTHDELMRRRGKYYEMFTVQGKYYSDNGAVREGAAVNEAV